MSGLEGGYVPSQRGFVQGVGMYRDRMSCLSAMVRQHQSRRGVCPNLMEFEPIAPAAICSGRPAEHAVLPCL